MAWEVKYRGEFNDLTYSGATEGLLWTIDIEEDGYSGSINTMLLTGQPLIIEHLAAGDDLIFSPVKGSKATINVISEEQFQYTGLYSAENLKYRVSIYYGDTPALYWQGYLTTEYTEDYNDTPYNVSVTASDGLGLLKEMDYLDADGDKYLGRRYESQIILDILGKINATEFKEFVNLYDTLMADDTDDSPFDQCLINVERFYDSKGIAWSCYAVIEEILKKYNAVIRQIRGEYVIYRPTELTGATVYGRHFTAYNTKTGISITPEQNVRRTGNSSAVADFNGGVLMMTTPLSKFTAEQDYGYRESWLANYRFESMDFSSFNPSTWIERWEKVGVTANLIDGGGVQITGYTTGPLVTRYITQSFGDNAVVSATDTIRLSFSYEIINNTGAPTDVAIWVHITDSTAANYLQIKDEIELQWVTSGNHIVWTEAEVPEGRSTYTFDRVVEGIPVTGPLIAKIFETKDNTFLIIKDFKFNITSDKIIFHKRRRARLEGVIAWFDSLLFKITPGRKAYKEVIDGEEVAVQEHTATNNINAPESLVRYYLGDVTKDETGVDNIIEQFMGSLAVLQSGALEMAASDFVATHGADYFAAGVNVSAIGSVLYFTATEPGTDFTGASSITNTSGDLAGTVATVQANQTAVARIDEIVISGTSGEAFITCDGKQRWMEFTTDIDTTGAAFVSVHATDYLSGGVVITYNSSQNKLKFTSNTPGQNFTGHTTIENYSGDLTGTVTESATANRTALARQDSITLSGSTGGANITVSAVTEAISAGAGTGYAYTSSWHTRGNTENLTLLQLIANEVKALYIRERHFIQMQLRESSVTAPDVNIMYNLMDTVNRYNNYTRIFAFNRGTLDVKKREWSADIMEIGVSSTALYTADDDNTTVDSTSITVDSD